jgi:hypothetical protein
MTKELQYINWFDSPNWSADVILGKNQERYRFTADWNNRNDSWMITIASMSNIILEGIQLVLGVDLLAYCHSEFKPQCILYAATPNINIERISFANMVSADVKLYHITDEDLN